MKKCLGTRTAAALILAVIGLAAGCDKAPPSSYPTADRLTAGIFLDAEAERAVLPEGVELRKVYDKGIELTKESEGFRGRLYHDAAGYCTIGYGHLVKLAPCDWLPATATNLPSSARESANRGEPKYCAGTWQQPNAGS